MFALELFMSFNLEVLDSGKYKKLGVFDIWKQLEYLALEEYLSKILCNILMKYYGH